MVFKVSEFLIINEHVLYNCLYSKTHAYNSRKTHESQQKRMLSIHTIYMIEYSLKDEVGASYFLRNLAINVSAC